ncbi:hypothetical protein D3C77_552830 [compost metagenome]
MGVVLLLTTLCVAECKPAQEYPKPFKTMAQCVAEAKRLQKGAEDHNWKRLHARYLHECVDQDGKSVSVPERKT